MQDEKLSCDTSGMRTRPHLGTGCHFPVVSGQPLIKVRAALDHHWCVFFQNTFLDWRPKKGGWVSESLCLPPRFSWVLHCTRSGQRVGLPFSDHHPESGFQACLATYSALGLTLCTEEIQGPQGFCLTPPHPNICHNNQAQQRRPNIHMVNSGTPVNGRPENDFYSERT